MNKIRKKAAKLGFTLIELSIVLVIIGLIVGGILVGQDLIKAAEIRATVSQMEKYSTAVNTFRGKYNGIPGDLLNASNFGFDSVRGINNGNSVIESMSADSGSFAGEASCFWDDLSYAGMISDSLNSSSVACGTSQSSTLSQSIPAAKMGRSNYLVVGSNAGINYWSITGVSSLAAGLYTTTSSLTAAEAFQIDSKVDDGAGTSGGTLAVDSSTAVGATQISGRALFITTNNGGGTTTAGCIQSATAGLYNFTYNNGNAQACQLRLRSSF